MARTGVSANLTGSVAKAVAHVPAEVSSTLRRGTAATLAGGMARVPVDTGRTKNSHAMEGATPGSLSMEVTVSTDYAEAVHDGTLHMPGRPWLRETTEQTFPAVIRELEQLEKSL